MREKLSSFEQQVKRLEKEWAQNPRWKGIKRDYKAEDVILHRKYPKIEYTLAKNGAERWWADLKNPNIKYKMGLGTIGGMSVLQKIHAGFDGIFYVSGWQTAAGNNVNRKIYPDQSIYSPISLAMNVQELNNAMSRGYEIDSIAGINPRDWFLPIMVDAEAGFGGIPNTSEIMTMLIEAGAAGVHFEDQDSTHKKCGHLAGKVVIPTQEFIAKLNAARQASDILDIPTILMARTDAMGAGILNNDIDERDKKYLTGERVEEGLYVYRGGLQAAIERALAYAPYADMLWYETANPSLKDAEEFANAIFKQFPGKLLAYNCSPSMKWRDHFKSDTEKETANKLKEYINNIAGLGYKYPFITLFDFHVMNLAVFEQTQAFLEDGMSAFSKLQEHGYALQKKGYSAVKHQQEAGTYVFDHITQSVTGGKSSTLAMKGSTEEEQFNESPTG